MRPPAFGIDLLQALLGAAGSALALAVDSWPSGWRAAGIGAVGLLGGMVVAYFVERAWATFTDKSRLRHEITVRDEKIANLESQLDLTKEQLRVAKLETSYAQASFAALDKSHRATGSSHPPLDVFMTWYRTEPVSRGLPTEAPPLQGGGN